MEALVERFIPEREANFAKHHFELYTADNVDEIISELNPKAITESTEGELEKIIDYIPNGEPLSVQVVGSNSTSTPSSKTVNLTIQYEYPETWLFVTISVDSTDDRLMVNGINAQTAEMSLQEQNAFRLGANGLLGYTVVLFAIAVPIFCIFTFVLCLRTKIPKRKWAWALFTLMGFVTFKMNWTTGAWGVSIVSMQLLGAGFVRPGFAGPWILSIAFPLGALIFLSKRSQWLGNPGRDEA